MLKLNSIILLIVLFLVSCGGEKEETQKPNDLLDKSKMAAILTDITLMEAAANVKATQSPIIKVDSVLKFNIYKQHMVSRKQYEASLKYYSANANEFKAVYDIVFQNINKQKGK